MDLKNRKSGKVVKSSKGLNFNRTFWRCGFGRSMGKMNNYIDNAKFFFIVFVPSGKQKKMENGGNKENKKKNANLKSKKLESESQPNYIWI